MLRGVDYFLLPAFLKDLLQPGGYDTMLVERDAWFQSGMCFIRDGINCLAALKKQQEMGLQLLDALEQGVGHKYDDHMPGEDRSNDTKPNLGLGRRQIGSDQAMRAGQLFDTNTSAAGTSTIQVRAIPFEGIPSFAGAPTCEAELSDTDNEEHQQKRRRSANGRGRRRHLLSPTSARTRVLSSQARHSSKRIKTEAVTAICPDMFLHETPHRSPSSHSNSEKQNTRLVVGENPMGFGIGESNHLPSKSKPRFRVDCRHLAALMAVGASPPSSPL